MRGPGVSAFVGCGQRRAPLKIVVVVMLWSEPRALPSSRMLVVAYRLRREKRQEEGGYRRMATAARELTNAFTVRTVTQLELQHHAVSLAACGHDIERLRNARACQPGTDRPAMFGAVMSHTREMFHGPRASIEWSKQHVLSLPSRLRAFHVNPFHSRAQLHLASCAGTVRRRRSWSTDTDQLKLSASITAATVRGAGE